MKRHTVRDKLRLCQNFLQKLRFLADEVCPVPERGTKLEQGGRGCIGGSGPLPLLCGVCVLTSSRKPLGGAPCAAVLG